MLTLAASASIFIARTITQVSFLLLSRVHSGFLQGLGLGFPIDQKHPRRVPPTGRPVASNDAAVVAQASRDENDKLDEFSE